MTTTVEGEEIKINGTYSYVYDGKYPRSNLFLQIL